MSTAIAEGIRLISVQRGVDPRHFSLLAFGGAAGLQAVEVARQLGVTTVYVPQAAPVLSAYGMLSTDLKYDFSRSYRASIDSLYFNTVQSIIGELESEGRSKLESQGLPSDKVNVTYSADMRYLDQVYEVNVDIPDLHQEDGMVLEQWTSNFHRRYQELFSYRQTQQEVRLITLRVAVVGELPKAHLPAIPANRTIAQAEKGQRRIYLGKAAGWQDVPVYAMDRLPVAAQVVGPAILESGFTTVLLDIDDTATADSHGGIQILVSSFNDVPGESTTTKEAAPDPVTLAVIEHRLESIAQEMTEVMLRTSMSQILNTSHDFSTAILDSESPVSYTHLTLPTILLV